MMTTQQSLGWAALAGLAGLLTLPPAATAGERKEEGRKVPDQEFVQKASAAALTEVNLGLLAARQASGDRVKQLARRLADDHTRAVKELTRMADKKGFRLAPAESRD